MSTKIDSNRVKKIARLARLHVEDQQIAQLTDELNKVLHFVEQLRSINVEGVEPLTSVVERDAPLRKDVVTDGGICEKILKNAPQKDTGYFVVPRAVE